MPVTRFKFMSIPAVVIALSLPLTLASCDAAPKPQASLDPYLVHNRILTLDTHVDIPLNYMTEIDPGMATELQVDLGKLMDGELDAAFFIIYTPQTQITDENLAAARAIAETRYAAIDALTRTYKDEIELALTADDVRRINASNKKVALMGIENAYPLGMNVDDVSLWAQRGVRYVGITHFGHNQFGDSSNPNATRDPEVLHGGLSDLGRELVTALNDAGIMVDASHAGKDTMMQAADLSRAPIIASHSGVKAVGDNPRNLDDEQLLKLKETGSVAQMVAFGTYLKPLNEAQLSLREQINARFGVTTRADYQALSQREKDELSAEMEALYDITAKASVADFVDHIDHAVKIAGIDYVGIASDFDGGGGVVGWEDASKTPNVTVELVARGYSEEDIAKIWGGNLLRVMEAVEAAAKR